MATILESSRTTLDEILKKDRLEKKASNDPKQFDMSQVKIDPKILENLDSAHRVIDTIIQSTQ